jgi:hypothetical protein
MHAIEGYIGNHHPLKSILDQVKKMFSQDDNIQCNPLVHALFKSYTLQHSVYLNAL